MNKKLLWFALLILAIPTFVFAQSAIKNKQRHARYKTMNKATAQMRDITFAVQQYAQDFQGKMPPMQNAAVFQKALRPYASQSSFVSVATGQPFLPNVKLSGKPLKNYGSNRIVWCYDVKAISLSDDPKNLANSYRVVGFSNAIIAMPDQRWQREKAASGIR